MWRKGKLKKEEFDKKCLCGHAKSSHGREFCLLCGWECETYEAQVDAAQGEKGD